MKKSGRIILIVALAVFLVAGTAVASPFNLNRPFQGENADIQLDSYWSTHYPTNNASYNEASLQTILNDTFGSNVIDDIQGQSSAALWNPSEADVDTYLIRMIKGDSGTLGFYSVSGGQNFDFDIDYGGQATLKFFLDGSVRVLDDSGWHNLTGFGSTFGFYWHNTTNQLYSYTEDSKNGSNGYGPSGNMLALSYLIPNGTAVSLPGVIPSTAQGNNDWVLAFEDRPFGNEWGDGDFNDAVFYVEDMVPIPEPATMLLLGTGLIGLAGFGRKRFLKK